MENLGVIGIILFAGVFLIGNVLFNWKAKTMARVFILGLIGMVVYGMIASGDGFTGTALFGFIFIVYALYLVVRGIVGTIYTFLTGGKKLTAHRLAMFVIGWVGAGKLLEMDKRKKEEHRAKMDYYETLKK